MSGRLAAEEPYTTQFSTTIAAVEGRDVRLETTYFSPERGGLPADTGRIGTARIEDVQLVDGAVVHRLAEPPSFRAGRSALCTIDWERRMYCMRAATAGHVLYGAAERLFDGVSYHGIDVDAPDGELGGDERLRVAFETDAAVDRAALADLERLANRAVWDAREVTWEERSVEEMFTRDGGMIDEMLFQDDDAAGETLSRDGDTVDGRLAASDDTVDSDTVRVVSIDGWSSAVSTGPHVRNTRELGPVTVLGWSDRDDGVVTVECAVGPAGIERRSAEKRAALAAGRALDIEVDSVPDVAERLDRNRD